MKFKIPYATRHFAKFGIIPTRSGCPKLKQFRLDNLAGDFLDIRIIRNPWAIGIFVVILLPRKWGVKKANLIERYLFHFYYNRYRLLCQGEYPFQLTKEISLSLQVVGWLW